jgi:hypothetical protein
MNSDVPWRFLRFRHDKIRANHQSVVEKIKQSIMDGITEDQARTLFFFYKKLQKKRKIFFKYHSLTLLVTLTYYINSGSMEKKRGGGKTT